jgi:hypothetical protein
MIELERLDATVDAFAVKMKEKLAAKFAQGFTGWDSTTPAGTEEWVDLANFCMFLYRMDHANDEISA